ncbi:MAG: hypothetical protein ACE5GL_03155 [Calditrichia bacterium]
MLLIADSGSTKADWKILGENGKKGEFSTMGFNPNYHSESVIVEILQKELVPKVPVNEVHRVIFYGAGCWDSRRKGAVASAMRKVFTHARVDVDHDLLAAARATCGTMPGIACILGTGSNSILYDGEMPEDLKMIFERWIPGGKSWILDKIYGEGVLAVNLASFARFMSDNKHHPFVKKLVNASFDEFISRQVCKYENHQNLSVHFVGSVAFYFKHVLCKVLVDKGLNLGMVIKKPIDNLAKYHLEKEGLAQKL